MKKSPVSKSVADISRPCGLSSRRSAQQPRSRASNGRSEQNQAIGGLTTVEQDLETALAPTAQRLLPNDRRGGERAEAQAV